MSLDSSSRAKSAPAAASLPATHDRASAGSLPAPEWFEDIRAHYGAVAAEPMPRHFIDLLQQIAQDLVE